MTVGELIQHLRTKCGQRLDLQVLINSHPEADRDYEADVSVVRLDERDARFWIVLTP